MALSTLDPETKPDGSHDDLPDMSPAEKAESEQLLASATGSSLYQGAAGGGAAKGKGRGKGWIKKRVQYSLASTLLIAGLGLGSSGAIWMAGPGQLVMFAETFKDFTMGVFNKDQDDFSSRLGRKLLFKDRDTGERKLSLAGRKMWRHMERGLKKTQGLTFDVDKRTGDLTGIRKNGELIRDLSEGATDAVTGRKITQKARRLALRAELRNAGVGRFSYYTKYRPVLQKRFRVGFTPFENAKRKGRVAARDWFEKKFKKAVVDGDADGTRVVGENENADEEGLSEEEKDERKRRNETASTNAEAADANRHADLDLETGDIEAGKTGYEARMKSKGRLKLGAKGVMGFALMGCAVISMDSTVDTLAHAQRAVPAIRIANQFFAAGGQIQAGDIGSLEEVAEMTKLLSSSAVTVVKNTGEKVIEPAKSWIDTAESRMAIGSPWHDLPGLSQDLHPSPNNMRKGLKSIADFFRQIPGFNTICSVSNNPLAQLVMTGADLLSPGSFLIGEALNRVVVGPFLEKMMKYAAGPAFDLAAMGPWDYPGITMAGGLLSATNTALDAGGWLVSHTVANENRAKYINERRKEFAQRPILDRIFDYTHPDSLITQATFSVPHNKQQAMLAIANAPKSFLSGLGSIIFPDVFAADDDCRGQATAACLEGFDAFGIEEAGWSKEDKEKALTYEPDFLVDWYEGNEQPDEECEGGHDDCDPKYDEKEPLTQSERRKLDKCFEPGDENNSHDFEGDGCDLFDGSSDKAIMFRAARMYVALGEGFACADDAPECPTGAASEPATGTTPGTISADSSGTPCAANTEDYGIREDAYNDGQLIKIRLCGITSIPGPSASSNESVAEVQEDSGKEVKYAMVSSIASESWQKLGEAAQAAGVSLTAGSSFRTMEHQEALCADNTGCSNGTSYGGVAKPGTSNHQAGLAIDISEIYQAVPTINGSKAASGKTCDSPQVANVRTYEWLIEDGNAARFGIKNYANEAWHWGTAEECTLGA